MSITAYQFKLPITTEGTLKEFIRLAWGVTIPDIQVCKHHTTPWRAFADAYFARQPVTVWHGSRGFAGKSYTLAVLGLTEAVTLSADVNILGGSGAQSKRVLEHEMNLWNYEHAPRHLLLGDTTSSVTRLTNGAKIEALMASQASVRGPHPQKLLLDEIDEMDMSILEAAQGQPMSRNGITTQTVMSSTRQYRNGTMQKILERAHENKWGIYSWCWRETVQPRGWLKPEDVENKKLEITGRMWETEYENQEPSAAAAVFDNLEIRAITDEEIKQFDNVLHGLDFGFYPDPAHYSRSYFNAAQRTLYIYGEVRRWKTSNEDMYKAIKEYGYEDADLLIADSAEPKSIFDFRAYGANCRGAEKGKDSIKYRVKWMQGLIKIVIDPVRAPYSAKEFTNFEYEQTKDGEIISTYQGHDDHAIASVGYGTNLLWRKGGV